MPKLHHLRDFLAIAQRQSVHGAARALGLTQPALTRSLRELEHEVGSSLFERHARGVVLTEIGERFLARAQASMEELRLGLEEAAQLRGQMTGSVTVALSSAPVLRALPDAFREFRTAFPEVRLRIIERLFPAVEPLLRDGRIDFYVGPSPERMPPGSYQVDLLFRNERMVYARKDHPLRGARSLRDLMQGQWIVTGLRERPEEEFAGHFTRLGLEAPRIVTVVESSLAIMALLQSTDAMAILSRQLAESPLFEQRLEPVRLRERLVPLDVVQVTRSRLPLTPVAERLAVLIQRAAGEPHLPGNMPRHR